MRLRPIFFVIIALIVGAAIVMATPKWRGEPWRIKRGLDLAGGVRVVLEAETDKLQPGQKWSHQQLNSIVRILEKRVNATGAREPVIQPKGEKQIIIELPDIKNKEQAVQDIRSTARMEFRHFYNVHDSGQARYRPVAAKYTMDGPVVDEETGEETYSFTDIEGNDVPVEKVMAESKLILAGDDIEPVSAGAKDPQSYRSVVDIQFTKEGRKKFADFTRRNVHEILAIILDGKILSAPQINEPILNGRAQISGNFTPDSAQKLAEFINAGALPVPLKIVQIQSVEATLGQASVNRSVTAGIGGLTAVVLFMFLYYLLPGLVADVALAIYALLLLAAFKMLGITLTLPGIAGFILSIGMAVDANILIFERLKEELRSGKTLRAAIDAGFSRAFTSIFDSNMCTLITCAILGYFGTGPIRGFAYVLAIGVAISMFTAIVVTRTILHLIVNTSLQEKPWLFGLGRQWVTGKTGRQVDIVGRMWVWFGLSAAILIPGLYFWLGPPQGLHKGIDFTGGSMMQVEFKQPTATSAIDKVLADDGFSGSPIQKSSSDPKTAFIRTKEITAEQLTQIKTDIQEKLDGSVVSAEQVGPTISKELTTNAIKAILYASLAIVLYLSVRFAIGGLASGFRFGMCAILATLHDVGVILGTFAILGYFLHWEIDSLFVTAVLTIIGFSTHDTIVIFDRIRENLRHRMKGESFDGLVNRSILQSFARSINTSFTVVLTLTALMLFGAQNIRYFVVALLIGVISGTYSSIFNASQLLVLWQRITDKQPVGKYVAEPANVRAARARDLTPVAVEGVEISEEVEAVSAQAKAAGTKAKSKKRRRRF